MIELQDNQEWRKCYGKCQKFTLFTDNKCKCGWEIFTLTEEQAKYISEEIMGYKYSHHDDNCIYKELKQENPTIMFYPGMCPYSFSMDTVTGKVDMMFDSMSDTILELTLYINKKLGDKAPKDPKFDKIIEDYKERCDKQERVNQYLLEQELITDESALYHYKEVSELIK